MVNIVFPPPEEPLEPKKEFQARNTRQVINFIFMILVVALALAGLWYAQASGYLSLIR